MQTKSREYRAIQTGELRTATSEDGSRTVTGLIPYNSRSVDMGFFEVIAPGAFGSALAPGADVLCLRDHKSELLMGRTKSGTLSLEDSDIGLRFTCKLPNTTQAADLAASIDRGDLDANSFGFICTNDVWTNDGNGNAVRTLLSVELLEVSCVSFPAYTASSVSVRSCPAELRSLLKTEKRDDDPDDEETDSVACECQCPECLDGDCADCSDADCSDDGCDCDNDTLEQDSTRNNVLLASILTRRTH